MKGLFLVIFFIPYAVVSASFEDLKKFNEYDKRSRLSNRRGPRNPDQNRRMMATVKLFGGKQMSLSSKKEKVLIPISSSGASTGILQNSPENNVGTTSSNQSTSPSRDSPPFLTSSQGRNLANHAYFKMQDSVKSSKKRLTETIKGFQDRRTSLSPAEFRVQRPSIPIKPNLGKQVITVPPRFFVCGSVNSSEKDFEQLLDEVLESLLWDPEKPLDKQQLRESVEFLTRNGFPLQPAIIYLVAGKMQGSASFSIENVLKFLNSFLPHLRGESNASWASQIYSPASMEEGLWKIAQEAALEMNHPCIEEDPELKEAAGSMFYSLCKDDVMCFYKLNAIFEVFFGKDGIAFNNNYKSFVKAVLAVNLQRWHNAEYSPGETSLANVLQNYLDKDGLWEEFEERRSKFSH